MSSENSILRNYFKIWSHLSHRKKRLYVVAIFLSILGGLAEILSLGTLYPFITIILAPEQLESNRYFLAVIQYFKISDYSNLATPVTIIFISLTIFTNLLRLIIIKINSRLAFSTGVDISSKLFEKTLSQNYARHIKHNSSEFISAATRKIDHLTVFILFPSLNFFGSLVNTLAIIFTLFIVNFYIAFTSFIVFGVIYIVIARYSRNQLNKNSKTVADEVIVVNKSLQEGFGSIRELILYRSQRYFIQLFSLSDRRLKLAQGNNIFLALSPRYILEGTGIILIALFAYYVSNNNDEISYYIPVLGVLALGAQRLIPAMQQIYTSWANIKSNQASLNDILNLLEIKELHDGNLLNEELEFNESIKFKDCYFKYDSSNLNVLQGISLDIKKGSSVGLMGSTGSGKTTFVNVLMGLLLPTKGDIYIDGDKLALNNLSSWQSKIALVPQDIYLADVSIAENIAFGQNKNDINIERVIESAKKAKVHTHISSLQKKYDTTVGEGGISLSGGQIQRIGIARALYQNKEVLVIDEGTSALDVETEKAVMKSINSIDDSITLVLIAHRLSTLLNCDFVIKFDAGKIDQIYSKSEFINYINNSDIKND